MHKLPIILGVVIGVIIVTIVLGIHFLFNGMCGIPFGKTIVSANIQGYLRNVYPQIKFDIKKIKHEFKGGVIAKIEAKTKTPTTFHFYYSYNDEDFLNNLILRELPEFNDKALTINPILPSGKKMKDYLLIINVKWYEKNITKDDFLSKSFSIYELLTCQGVYPEKMLFESQILMKSAPYDGRTPNEWDYTAFKVDLNKAYKDEKWEELINRVTMDFYKYQGNHTFIKEP